MKSTRTKFIVSVSIVTALFSCGAFVFFFKIIEHKNEHTSAVLATLGNKMKEKENTTLLEKKTSDVEQTHALIASRFVNLNDVDTFVAYLENTGSKNSAVLSVKKFEVSSDPHTILVSVSIKGSFDSVMRTIGFLENAPYKISITNAYLNKELDQTALNPITKNKTAGPSVWQADVAFTVISS